MQRNYCDLCETELEEECPKQIELCKDCHKAMKKIMKKKETFY